MTERRIHPPLEARVPDFNYSKIPDEQIRVDLRTGEFIAVAAIRRGIQFPIEEEGKGDEWTRCTPHRLVTHLQGILDQHTVTVILKEAKRIAHASQINGDNQAVASQLHRLIREVGRAKNTLPELP